MEEDYFQRNKRFNDIYYLTKGTEACVPSHHYGPARREYYLIHLIEEGKGIFISNGVTYNLKKGQFFLIYPNETNYYKADEDFPWKYSWIGFHGENVEMLLKSIGLSKQTPVGSVENAKDTIKLMNKIIKAPITDNKSLIILQGYLYLLLANLSIGRDLYDTEHKSDVINKDIEYTNQAIQIIQDNYHRIEFSIYSISEKMALNPSYLSQLFKRTTGRTMNDYLIDYRLQKSREILDTTQESIQNISEMVGYSNPLSFTRIFKSKMKMTPSKYRKVREHYKSEE
ncbi:AraC family transcriptional regulator [Alkalibacterium sp. f15]|uniref:AraC family transcriptional regulator n=1 Tax=Alkalibacterium sp. f15 TaxID=3414029 RepID=UPI003BF8B91B